MSKKIDTLSILNYLSQNDLIPKQHLKTLSLLHNNPNATSAELSFFSKALSTQRISARLRELELMRIVTKGPKRACTVTTKKCYTWKFTGNKIPHPYQGSAAKKRRKFFLNIYDNKIDVFSDKTESQKKIKDNIQEIVEVVEVLKK